jgi:hypothetical protein
MRRTTRLLLVEICLLGLIVPVFQRPKSFAATTHSHPCEHDQGGFAAPLVCPPGEPFAIGSGTQSAPHVRIDSICTPDSKQLCISYTVFDNGSGQPFSLNVFRAVSPLTGSSRVSIVGTGGSGITLSGSESKTGVHRIRIQPPGTGGARFVFNQRFALRPDLRYKYVLTEADGDGAFNVSDRNDRPHASFRIWVVGAIAHGYEFGYLNALTGGLCSPPADSAVEDMKARLEANDYDLVVAAHWEADSVTPKAGLAIKAGDHLAETIRTAAAGIEGLCPNDVIDVVCIGHSRGTVVISEALQKLIPTETNPVLPQLAAGFMTEVLVDPHPANTFNVYHSQHTRMNRTGVVQWVLDRWIVNGFSLGRHVEMLATAIRRSIRRFYAVARDPAPWIPANVQAAVDYYQQTPASELPLSSLTNPIGEGVQNLWGIDPGLISSAGASLVAFNETRPGLGHHEIFYELIATRLRSDHTLAIAGLRPFSSDGEGKVRQAEGAIHGTHH